MTAAPTPNSPSPEFETFDAIGWPVAGDAAGVARSIAEGRPVDLDNPRGVPLPAFPDTVTDGSEDATGRVVVTEMEPQLVLSHASVPTVVLSPPTLIVGMGCNAGVEVDELRTHLDRALAEQLLTRGSVAAIASLDTKADEPGLLALASEMGLPLLTYPSEALADQNVPTPSDVVAEVTGTPSVAEAAVVAAGAELIVPKHVASLSTVAVGRLPQPTSGAGSSDDSSSDGSAADGTSGAR